LSGWKRDVAALDNFLASETENNNAGESPFSDFDEINIGDDFISFSFGDYRGNVSKVVYASFVDAYREKQKETGEPMLDDILRSWLNV